LHDDFLIVAWEIPPASCLAVRNDTLPLLYVPVIPNKAKRNEESPN